MQPAPEILILPFDCSVIIYISILKMLSCIYTYLQITTMIRFFLVREPELSKRNLRHAAD